jgi:hypothetical protein
MYTTMIYKFAQDGWCLLPVEVGGVVFVDDAAGQIPSKNSMTMCGTLFGAISKKGKRRR